MGEESLGTGVGSCTTGGGAPNMNPSAPPPPLKPKGRRSWKRKVPPLELTNSTIPEYFKTMRTVEEVEEETQELDKVAPPQEDKAEEDVFEEQEPWITDSWEEFATRTMSTMEQEE